MLYISLSQTKALIGRLEEIHIYWRIKKISSWRWKSLTKNSKCTFTHTQAKREAKTRAEKFIMNSKADNTFHHSRDFHHLVKAGLKVWAHGLWILSPLWHLHCSLPQSTLFLSVWLKGTKYILGYKSKPIYYPLKSSLLTSVSLSPSHLL